MTGISYGDDGPIAAFATPLADSALALIRCSGPGSIEKTAAFFSSPERLRAAGGHSVVHGWITGQEGKIDEVLISVYRAPKSYTGEEGLDISCHGGIAAARGVMEVLKEAGFRDALPGEFTFRAFMNGKLDLTRAESVMEMVSAKTGAGRSRAVRRLAGDLEREIREIGDRLTWALAETEIYLDYPEDEFFPAGDAAPAGDLPGRSAAEEALDRLRGLSDSFGRERLYRDGIFAVIAGKPNAGKSSLFNRLIGEDRSIVAASPGTTRDWIEAWISLEGIPVRLADTAGLRAGVSADPVENTGVERSRELMAQADLILYVVDGTEGLVSRDREFLEETGRPNLVLPVWNKADAPSCSDAPEGFFRVSAKTGEGVAELCAGAVSLSGGKSGETGRSLGTERQKALVDAAASALVVALALADQGGPLDAAASLLREAVNALGEITGEVSSADILEKMFSRFCVGK